MPGIAGIIRRRAYEGIGDDLRRMVEAMCHETYYASGEYVNQECGVYVGWVCHRDSFSDCLPLVSKARNAVLLFHGEEYGERSHGRDARQLVEQYEELGDEFLGGLNGWFCGLIANLSRGTITLFNDRYGMGRIYFHEGKEEFIFASEAKSLLRVRPELRAIDAGALAQYLRMNCVMGSRSLFKGISVLPAGACWVFEGGAIARRKCSFDFADWEQQPTLGADDFYESFAETVSRVFPAYMEGLQRVGLSLTAGLDTRVILAAARGERSLPCYTFGGLWGETFDVRTARKLARMCGQGHEVIRIDEGFFEEFPRLARDSVYVSDGTHDAFGAHDVYFNKVAHDVAPIRLTGKFGSEVVRTRRLIRRGDFPRDLVQPGFRPFLDEVPSLDEISGRRHPLSRVVCEEIPWYEFGRVAIEQSKVILRTPYMDNEIVKLMFQAPAGLRASRDLQVRYVKEKRYELSALLTNLGRIGSDGEVVSKLVYIPFWLLFKAEYMYLYAMPHWLTRLERRFEGMRPERVLAGRQKFEAYRIWIRRELADFVRQTLLNPGAHCTEFFDKAALARVTTRHIAGTHNYLSEINKMLTLELMCSSLLEG